VGLQAGLAMAVTAAVVGALVEHVTVGIDDNLAVPVATAIAVAGVAALL
jgi:hypothetical protein